MISAAIQPSISELTSFVAKVDSFPISAGQLISLARDKGASPRIVNFYKKFAAYRIFENKDDLATSSEQVDILRSEEHQMPKEEEKATDDF